VPAVVGRLATKPGCLNKVCTAAQQQRATPATPLRKPVLLSKELPPEARNIVLNRERVFLPGTWAAEALSAEEVAVLLRSDTADGPKSRRFTGDGADGLKAHAVNYHAAPSISFIRESQKAFFLEMHVRCLQSYADTLPTLTRSSFPVAL
jgi:hypothetical protein